MSVRTLVLPGRERCARLCRRGGLPRVGPRESGKEMRGRRFELSSLASSSGTGSALIALHVALRPRAPHRSDSVTLLSNRRALRSALLAVPPRPLT